MNECLINSDELKGKIRSKGWTQIEFAEIIEMSYSTFNLSLNNKREFSHSEIYKISEKLNLTNEEIINIFFKQKV